MPLEIAKCVCCHTYKYKHLMIPLPKDAKILSEWSEILGQNLGIYGKLHVECHVCYCHFPSTIPSGFVNRNIGTIYNKRETIGDSGNHHKRKRSLSEDDDIVKVYCAYCTSYTLKKNTTVIPKDRDMLELWGEILGDRFLKRSRTYQDPRICLKHFHLDNHDKRKINHLPIAEEFPERWNVVRQEFSQDDVQLTSKIIGTGAKSILTANKESETFSKQNDIGENLSHPRIVTGEQSPESSNTESRVNFQLARMFLNSGLGIDIIENPLFISFMKTIAPTVNVPSALTVGLLLDSIRSEVDPLVNHFTGPLSVTVDAQKSDQGIFFAYSVHYFKDSIKKCSVYLKRIATAEFDGNCVNNIILQSIPKQYSNPQIKIANIVTSDNFQKLYINHTGKYKYVYTCFYTHMTEFVHEVLAIDELKLAVEILELFVLKISRDSIMYRYCAKIHSHKTGYYELPVIDESSWLSTQIFLTKCLNMHETFLQVAKKFRIEKHYIDSNMFFNLSYLQKFLALIQEHSVEMTNPLYSVSKILPTVVLIENWLTSNQENHYIDIRKKIIRIFGKTIKRITERVDNMTYKYACLLDPRYGYKSGIHDKATWNYIEESFIAQIYADLRKDPECPNATKFTLINLISGQLKFYRFTACNRRPNEDQCPINWWMRKMPSLTILLPVARELLVAPAVAIDVKWYFGVKGKYTHMCSSFNDHLDNSIAVATLDEPFRGRGSISQSTTVYARENQNSTRLYDKEEKVERDNVIQSFQMKSPFTLETSTKRIKSSDNGEVKCETLHSFEIANSEEIPKTVSSVCSRNCFICSKELGISSKSVPENERLLLASSMIVSQIMNMKEARLFYKEGHKNLICNCHFEESCIRIFDVLDISAICELFETNSWKMIDLFNLMKNIVQTPITTSQCKEFLIMFAGKYFKNSTS